MDTGISVREALATRGFDGSRVVAGAAGLDNLIKTVTVAEVPDAMDWLRGGELVVTTAYHLKEDAPAQADWVRGLQAHRAVALAIKPARFIGAIPEGIRQVGDELAFPVIELPPDVTWPAIIEGVLNLILDRQSDLMQRSAAIHSRLTQLVLDSRGLEAITRTLCDLTGNPVIVEDRWFNLLAIAMPPDMDGPAVATRLHPDYLAALKLLPEILAIRSDQRKTSIAVALPPAGEQKRQRIWPVRAGNEVYGFLTLLEVNPGEPEKDLVAMEHGATVIALELVKRQAAFEAEERLRADLLRALLEEGQGSGEEVREKAAALGLDLGGPILALIIRVEVKEYGPTSAKDTRPLLDMRMPRQVASLLQELDPAALVVSRQNDMVAIFHPARDATPASLKERASAWLARLSREFPRRRFLIGLGNTCDGLEQIRKSYAEARTAVNGPRASRPPGRWCLSPRWATTDCCPW